MSNALKVLIIDDAVFYRKIIADCLEELSDIEVVGSAPNGAIGLKKAEQLQPDVVTLDVEMPEMDGLETLSHLKRQFPDLAVIMLSSKTRSGAAITIEALGKGALDFIEKPQKDTPEENIKSLTSQLKKAMDVLITKKMLARPNLGGEMAVKLEKASSESISPGVISSNVRHPIKVLGIGISTGGPAALPVLLSQIPKSFRVPILIVQHMPPLFIDALVESLSKKCDIFIKAAEDGEEISAGTVYIAPGQRQMKLQKQAGKLNPTICLTDDPAENFCKPAADYLFRSLATHYGNNALGLIMTGMGKDGVEGLKMMKARGAIVYAQSEKTCTVYGMPMEAVNAGVVDEVIDLEQLADAVQKRVLLS